MAARKLTKKALIESLKKDLKHILADANWTLDSDSSDMENRLNNIREFAKFALRDIEKSGSK